MSKHIFINIPKLLELLVLVSCLITLCKCHSAPTSPSSSDSNSKSGRDRKGGKKGGDTNKWVVIGIPVAAGLIVLALILIVIRRCRQKNAHRTNVTQEQKNDQHTVVNLDQLQPDELSEGESKQTNELEQNSRPKLLTPGTKMAFFDQKLKPNKNQPVKEVYDSNYH